MLTNCDNDNLCFESLFSMFTNLIFSRLTPLQGGNGNRVT